MTAPARRAFAAAVALVLLPALALAAEPSDAKDLVAALRAIVEGSPLAASRAGIVVADLTSGEVVFAKDGDALLNPASNVKLVTTAAALARLGPEYRFSTEFRVDAGAPGQGAVRTLYVRGRGDPSMVTERLWGITGDLAHLGITRVNEIVLDDSFFDGERIGPGFDQEEGDRAYLAPAGAISLNFNSVAVYVGPGARRGARGRVELEPACDQLDLQNRTTTVAAKAARGKVTVTSVPLPNGRQRIVVEGRIPLGSRTQAMWRKVDQPALYFGSTLKRLLELRGVRVGRVRAGAVPDGARLVYVAQSDPLAEIVRRLNKTSNNFVAEQILKTLGAEVNGAPGSWPKGVAAVEDFLAEAGIPRGAYVMKNGSGLNDTNRFTARQLVTLLRAMWSRFPLAAEYLVSLPVAGRDGTIRWRMEGTEAAGHLRAKTGTLENVTSLSGYVETAGHKTFAFSILVNDYPGTHATIVRSVDAIGTALAASGGPAGELRDAVALAKGKAPVPAGATVTKDLGPSLSAFYALGRAGDPRNETFLRNALRGEGDPALRLAIAECIYLSDPGGETARRTFLDALSADPQVIARLWAAAPAGAPAPVLPSLGDLAGEGNPDALARLVELAPASSLDPKLGDAIADALAGVAASAPDELVQALRAAPAATIDSALGVLGSGLARSEERSAFVSELRALVAKGGELGTFAKALEPRLDAAIHGGDAPRPASGLVPVPAAATLPVVGGRGK